MTNDEIDAWLKNPGLPGIYKFTRPNDSPMYRKWDGTNLFEGASSSYSKGDPNYEFVISSARSSYYPNGDIWARKDFLNGATVERHCELDGSDLKQPEPRQLQLDLLS